MSSGKYLRRLGFRTADDLAKQGGAMLDPGGKVIEIKYDSVQVNASSVIQNQDGGLPIVQSGSIHLGECVYL